MRSESRGIERFRPSIATIGGGSQARDLERRLQRECFSVTLASFGKPKARISNPLVSGVLEVINQPQYDSFSIAANTAMAKQVMFQTPIGQSGKTLAGTNMTKAGQLEQPQKLVIYAIKLYVSNNTIVSDVQNFLTNCSFTLQVGKKPYLECPALFLQAGMGLVQYSASQVGTAPAGAAVALSTSNGIPDPRSTFILSQPITIEGGEGFQVIINPETAFNFAANTTNPPGSGIQVYVFLDGVLYRGVQ